MKVIKYLGGDGDEACGDEAKNDGLHIPGLNEQDAETLCGYAGTLAHHDEIEAQAPTCKNCISIAKELFLHRGYTKKSVKSW